MEINGRKMCMAIIPIICCFVLNNGLVQRRPKASTLQWSKIQKFLLSLGLRGNSKMQFPCVLGGMLFFCLRKKNGAMTPLWSFTFALWLCLFLVSSWQEQFLTFRLQCMFWWGVQIHVYFPRKPQACQAAAGGHAVVPDCVALWILSGLNCTVNADLPEWVLEAIHRLQRVC